MSNRPLKKIHLSYGETSLECLCLRDGSLDVNLVTGEVTSVARGRPKAMKIKVDHDGYLHFYLNRERPDRRGKAEVSRGPGGEVKKRYRIRRFVAVHRLVKMKELAIKAGGDAWRDHVRDLPRGIDVDHGDRNRANNDYRNLSLKTDSANRGKREMTPEEAAEVAACTF